MHKAYFDSVDRGPMRYIVLTQGHVDHVGGVDCSARAGHRDRRARQQPGAAGRRPARAAVPLAARLLRLGGGDRRQARQRRWTAAGAVAAAADHRCARSLRLRARRPARRDDRLHRRRDAPTRCWCGCRRTHPDHQQRLQRPVRPLPEPGHHPRRSLSRSAAVSRHAGAGARARRRAAAGRARPADRRSARSSPPS